MKSQLRGAQLWRQNTVIVTLRFKSQREVYTRAKAEFKRCDISQSCDAAHQASGAHQRRLLALFIAFGADAVWKQHFKGCAGQRGHGEGRENKTCQGRRLEFFNVKRSCCDRRIFAGLCRQLSRMSHQSTAQCGQHFTCVFTEQGAARLWGDRRTQGECEFLVRRELSFFRHFFLVRLSPAVKLQLLPKKTVVHLPLNPFNLDRTWNSSPTLHKLLATTCLSG